MATVEEEDETPDSPITFLTIQCLPENGAQLSEADLAMVNSAWEEFVNRVKAIAAEHAYKDLGLDVDDYGPVG